MPSDMLNGDRKLTKNEKRRMRDKESRKEKTVVPMKAQNASSGPTGISDVDLLSDVEIEYVSADYNQAGGSILDEFKEIFQKFAKPEELTASRGDIKQGVKEAGDAGALVVADASTLSADVVVGSEPKKLSKKKKKLASRLSVAELKQLVPRPDVVEAHDVTSADPRLLVYLKSYRNTVSVPRHWCHKRKYLQGKRGIEKAPFQLPDFIAETGIAKIRESVLEQESLKKSKQKARDRVQPKMGKIDIDYQVLHDAFFKFQKKPKMTIHGDIYYEGKEFEVDPKERKAGTLSAELKLALGIVDNTPPPWLINMQRYGPPPSYPNLRIPGLNAPIPPGASFGYQPNGWGKPPVDEYGRPLYGDVFGTVSDEGAAYYTEVVDKNRWGELSAMQAEEEDYDDEDDEDGDDEDYSVADDVSGIQTPSTLDGINSTISGLETPDTIDLRKRAGTDTPDSMMYASKELYHVIQEKKSGSGTSGQLFGSDKTYVLPGQGSGTEAQGLLENVDEVDEEGLVSGAVTGTETSKTRRKRKTDTSSTSLKRHKDFKF